MITDHANLLDLFTSYKASYEAGLGVAAPIWDRVAMEQPSTTSKSRYDWLGTFPGMREWLGDRVMLSVGSHGFEIENRPWEQTIAVEREKIEDDEYGVYSPLAMRMGESTAGHLDELVYGLMNAGRTTTCYDGENFFSASHPNNSDIGGVQSNIDSGGSGVWWYLADLRSMLKPIILQMRKRPEFVSMFALTDPNVFYKKEYVMGVDARYNVGFGLWQGVYASNQTLNEANFESAMIALSEIRGPNGKELSIFGNTLIVPTSLMYTAKRLINSNTVLRTGPSSEDGPVDNIHKDEVDILVSKHLSRTA